MDPKQTQPRRLALLLTVIALLVPTVSLFMAETRVGRALERRVYDGWFTIRGPLARPSDVVVVEIDEHSEEALGAWPWSRRWHAELLRNLHRAGASVVAFDISFAVPRPDQDSVFRHVIDSTGIAVLGAKTEFAVRRGGSAVNLEEPGGRLRGASIGIVDMPTDPVDAVVREYPVLHGYPGGRVVPELGFAALLHHLDLPARALRRAADGWRLGERPIPRGTGDGTLINFVGPRGSVSHYSYDEVLDDADTDIGWNIDIFEDHLADGVFEDKIVLVGSTIPEHKDMAPTPFRDVGGPTPAVEIHAHAVATILSGDHIRLVPWYGQYAWTFILAVIVILLTSRVRPWWGAGLTGVVAVGAVSASGYLFTRHGLWLWSVAPVLSLGLAYTGSTAALVLVAEREKNRIRGMFQQYVAASVVDELIENPNRLALGGEERVLTVLFSDLVRFSSIAERLTATELVELLNEYLTAMTEIVLDHGGIIDKYQGDALMAEFGAPVPVEDHARRACLAALEMRRSLMRLRERWAEEDRPLLRARTGINTGRMLVGNLGSRRVMDYTVMGDHVNLASRLEGANNRYGTEIIVSEFTWRRVEAEIVGRELDRVRVKGKAQPVRIYEILATRDEGAPPEIKRMLEDYGAALGLYKDRRFTRALDAFRSLADRHPGDGPTRVYIERCERYVRRPPPEGWDGVWETGDRDRAVRLG